MKRFVTCLLINSLINSISSSLCIRVSCCWRIVQSDQVGCLCCGFFLGLRFCISAALSDLVLVSVLNSAGLFSLLFVHSELCRKQTKVIIMWLFRRQWGYLKFIVWLLSSCINLLIIVSVTFSRKWCKKPSVTCSCDVFMWRVHVTCSCDVFCPKIFTLLSNTRETPESETLEETLRDNLTF